MDIEVYDLYKRTYKCDERESIRFAPMISKIYLDSVKKQRDQYKAERDTLIDDIAVLKTNISRLEQIRDIKDSALKGAEIKIKTLERDLSDALNGELATYDKSQKYVLKLEHENKRLTRLTHKLTAHRTMWDNLKDWRRGMLEIDKNDTQLISLGLVMDELEKRHLYKGDE